MDFSDFNFNLIRLAFTANVAIDQIGAGLFIAMIYVIVKYKKLHDMPCLKLIGLFMCCCLCSKLVIWLPYLIRVVPLLNAPLWLCFSVQLVPMTMLNGIMPAASVIGFDRLISVLFPIWYLMQRKPWWYFPGLCTLAALYPLYKGSYMVLNMIQQFPSNQPSNCTTWELYGPDKEPIDLNWKINVLTIAFYVLMSLKLLWNGRKGREAYFTRNPIFKTFTIIVTIQVIGQWAITCAYRYIPGLFHDLDENQIPLVFYGINCFSSLLITSEFFGIYYTSTEHRKALRKEFPRLCRMFPIKRNIIDDDKFKSSPPKKVNAITPLNVQVLVSSVSERRTK